LVTNEKDQNRSVSLNTSNCCQQRSQDTTPIINHHQRRTALASQSVKPIHHTGNHNASFTAEAHHVNLMNNSNPTTMSPINSPNSTSSASSAFFPASQPTPDNVMLAQRKQQLAHLQHLQRQQQQLLQQMTPGGSVRAMSGVVPSPSAIMAEYEQRNPGFSGGSYASRSTRFSSSVATPATIFECDYDANPTELYLAVQKKDWDHVTSIATNYPHEAATWVSRKEGDGKLRWRLLPLHAAIIFKAPEQAIGALLCAFAQGAACKDDQGMLPIHLAFRNTCDEEVVNLLLMAYPQSVDVQDRKGRTPMVLAQQTNHPNRDAYIRALERGSAYYAVANAAKGGMNFGGESTAPLLTEEERNNLEALQLKYDQLTVEHAERVNELEGELAKTQETSQVLVDHVNSLEAQLASRTDTERFLATKIANLDSQLKNTTKQLEETESNLQASNAELEEKNASLLSRAEAAESEAAEYKLALDDKRETAKKVYALTNKERISYEDRMEKCERDAAAHQANAAVLEAQLKQKIETEHALASQVSMLAAQLASSASNTSEATTTYQRKCEALTAENKLLKDHVAKLEKKLDTVATALDAMATEQERIVAAATRHEQTMSDAAAAHHRIVSDTARQESLLEDAAKEREQIVAILMRQAEDAERTISDREKVLEAVKEQEDIMNAAAEERDAVVASVNKQREYMDFMMNGELKFLKMTASEEEQEEVNEERMAEMEAKKEEFLTAAVEDEDMEEEESEDAVSDRDAELQAQIAVEEAMLAKLKAGEYDDEEEPVENDAEEAIVTEEQQMDVEGAVADSTEFVGDVDESAAAPEHSAPVDEATEEVVDETTEEVVDETTEDVDPPVSE
jgi:hypothetical protein